MSLRRPKDSLWPLYPKPYLNCNRPNPWRTAVRLDRRSFATGHRDPISLHGEPQRRRRARDGPNVATSRPWSPECAAAPLKVWQNGLVPLLGRQKMPISDPAVSMLEFGRIEISHDPLTEVNSPIQQSRFLQIVRLINWPRPQIPRPPLRNAYALDRPGGQASRCFCRPGPRSTLLADGCRAIVVVERSTRGCGSSKASVDRDQLRNGSGRFLQLGRGFGMVRICRVKSRNPVATSTWSSPTYSRWHSANRYHGSAG
jgi:hypothetical protein